MPACVLEWAHVSIAREWRVKKPRKTVGSRSTNTESNGCCLSQGTSKPKRSINTVASPRGREGRWEERMAGVAPGEGILCRQINQS